MHKRRGELETSPEDAQRKTYGSIGQFGIDRVHRDLLRDMGKQECEEGDCEVETARNIGADYVISGKVVRIEQLYVVTLKLHETQGGSLLGTETVEGPSQVELMRSLREHGRKLTSAAFGSRDVSR